MVALEFNNSLTVKNHCQFERANADYPSQSL